MDRTPFFQAQMPGNHCRGCGPESLHSLQLKIRWQRKDAVAVWQLRPEHVPFGGIIAALIDCHCMYTAFATAFRADGRPCGSDPSTWYVAPASR